ncbi:hypothetical protein SAMN05216417_11544 [Nitrosospira multiformis]|uniref:Uncharacterized protein n=1 Tax=Nitrosospira multiformis TaxID=1231 RepID=A0A1I7I766_9PROT|nr:hypothetical protein SAMN05216417_11544 [Nitrosospira multiformis]
MQDLLKKIKRKLNYVSNIARLKIETDYLYGHRGSVRLYGPDKTRRDMIRFYSVLGLVAINR